MRLVLLVQALFLSSAPFFDAPAFKPFPRAITSDIDEETAWLLPTQFDARNTSHGFMTSTDSAPIETAPQDRLASEHGENAGRRSLTMRLVLLVQVSYSSTISTDDIFLIVLPCPHVYLSIAYECLISCKLLVGGDIEENPGPTVEEMFQSLVSGQQAIREDLASLKERLQSTEKRYTVLKSV